ncbi:MAG: AAA family ATPase [Clostridia bacterium]|nr:AAA family ATPase [Clostridia bacterium]
MIIKKIQINGFGKFDNFEMELSDGMQVIYGPNEYGKSTIMEFIKIMFYSKLSGKKTTTAADKLARKKYLPWSGNQMSGTVEFIYGGNLYKVQKLINPGSNSDKTLLQNISTGETINLGKNEDVGEHIFGIDLKSFEKSSFVRSVGKAAFVSGKKGEEDSIYKKIISNLSETGEENVSKENALKRINSAITDLEKSRGTGGKIYETEFEIKNLNSQLYNLEQLEKNQADAKLKILKIKNLIKEKKETENYLRDFEKINKLKKINDVILNLEKINDLNKEINFLKFTEKELEEKHEELFCLKNKLKSQSANIKSIENLIHLSEEKNSLEELEKIKKRSLEIKSKKNHLKKFDFLVYGICLLAAIGAFCFGFLVNNYVYFPMAIIIGGGLAIGWNKYSSVLAEKENFNSLDIINNQIDSILNLKNSYSVEAKKISEAKKQFVQKISVFLSAKSFEEALKNFEKLEEKIKIFKNLKKQINIETNMLEIKEPDLQKLNSMANELRGEIKLNVSSEDAETKKERLKLLQKMNLEENYINLRQSIVTPKITAEEINNLKNEKCEKLKKMKNYLKSLKIARETIEEVSGEMRKNFSPGLDKRTSEIFDKLTGGKYKNIHTKKDYSMMVSNQFIDVSCDNLSSGTIDQAYLALRIAISEIISSKDLTPLTLDDSFIEYDDNRLNLALDFLKNYSEKTNRQIILFTCHEHIVNYAKSMLIKVI